LELAPAITELAEDATATPHARVHALWVLAGLEKLEESTIEQAIQDPHWFVSMTGVRLAGESKGVGAFFPDEFKGLAEKVSQNKDFPTAYTSYAALTAKSGYPSRVIQSYKDKEADWLVKDSELLSLYRKGRDHYNVSCGACHQADGKGLPNMAPTLASSDWVTGDVRRLIGVAVHGLMGPIKVNGKEITGVPPVMPAHGFMKDDQLASILTYVRNAWGNRSDAVLPEDIARYRKTEASRVAPWTESEF
jgi:mono/diheme cytochrome c family protein